VILGLMSAIWKQTRIPRDRQNALICSIPNKGDPTERDNYRGISLINVGLKVLSKLMITRIQLAVKARGRLQREQAGFRSKEERIAQVCALREIIWRRKHEGKGTIVVFIDFKRGFRHRPP
jgi:hypothetical protein